MRRCAGPGAAGDRWSPSCPGTRPPPPRPFTIALAVCKGPSLGTVFTLACPFTLLAHYTELDWAESCGVSRYLIRISVGLEDPEELWSRLDRALRGTT